MERHDIYGAETWTMRKEDVKRIEAFEMWTWRRMERISWTEHRTNEVLKKVEEKSTLMDIIRTRQKNWIGKIYKTSHKTSYDVLSRGMDTEKKGGKTPRKNRNENAQMDTWNLSKRYAKK